MKMIYYDPVKVTINAPSLVEMIIKAIIRHHGLLDLIVSNYSSVFTSKFQSSLYCFFEIKQSLSKAFYLPIDNQNKRQNSTIKAYCRVFINYQQDNQVQLLLIAEFTFNNTNNASTGHMLFELNYKYRVLVFYEKNVNPCFQSKSAKKLATKLKELMIVYKKKPQQVQEQNNTTI